MAKAITYVYKILQIIGLYVYSCRGGGVGEQIEDFVPKIVSVVCVRIGGPQMCSFNLCNTIVIPPQNDNSSI